MRKPLVFILIVILVFCLTISAQEYNKSQESVFVQRRQSMVINQLKSRDIIDPEGFSTLLKDADDALYDAKRSGRDCINGLRNW